MPSTALILLARYPRVGFVKTRLARDLGHDFATAFYRACAEHAFASVAAVRGGVRRYISVADPADVPAVRRWAGPQFSVIPQCQGDLGCRVRESLHLARCAGAEAGMVIATDTPDLSAHLLEQAVTSLATRGSDAVLGSGSGGGYYLFGVREPHPSLFSEIPWGTEHVADLTESRIAQLGLRCRRLPALADINTRAALEEWLGSPAAQRHPLRPVAERGLINRYAYRRSA